MGGIGDSWSCWSGAWKLSIKAAYSRHDGSDVMLTDHGRFLTLPRMQYSFLSWSLRRLLPGDALLVKRSPLMVEYDRGVRCSLVVSFVTLPSLLSFMIVVNLSQMRS